MLFLYKSYTFCCHEVIMTGGAKILLELCKNDVKTEAGYCSKKVKVSRSLIAVGAVGVRVPLYRGHS